MGVILSATDTLNWYAKVTDKSPAQLSTEVGEQLQAPTDVTFLPYLSGERTPHNDAAIRGAFIGLAHESDRAAMTRAVMEGVAFALRDNLEALRAAGTELTRITAIGGGSRSRYWLKAVATALNLPIDIPADGDFGAAFGAARLGLLAATGADPLAVCTPPETAETVAPRRPTPPPSRRPISVSGRCIRPSKTFPETDAKSGHLPRQTPPLTENDKPNREYPR
nr:FGGY-family carbohydrate kinase [Marinicella sp. W31]MDC2879900.1 FGGY-family carbohydrate kinase [Marinicella sp. W31]